LPKILIWVALFGQKAGPKGPKDEALGGDQRSRCLSVQFTFKASINWLTCVRVCGGCVCVCVESVCVWRVSIIWLTLKLSSNLGELGGVARSFFPCLDEESHRTP